MKSQNDVNRADSWSAASRQSCFQFCTVLCRSVDGDWPMFTGLTSWMDRRKTKSDSSNYRPIALTSCICKIMERMINNRLVWYLERNNFITAVHSGFRKQCSTTDHLVRLETFIREDNDNMPLLYSLIWKRHIVRWLGAGLCKLSLQAQK